MAHWSDCAVNRGPALPPGPCNCGNTAPEGENVILFRPRKKIAPDTAPSEYTPNTNDPA